MRDDRTREADNRSSRRVAPNLLELEKEAARRDRLEAVDWGEVTARLTAAAHRMLGKKSSLAEAQDVAQAAIVQLLDPDYKEWDPDKDILEHLGSVAWGMVRNRRTSAASKRTSFLTDVDEQGELGANDSLEREVEARALCDAIFGGLRDSFAHKALELALVELFVQGVDLPRDQVNALARPYAEVYRARTRVMDEARRLRDELESREKTAIEPLSRGRERGGGEGSRDTEERYREAVDHEED